MINRKKEGFTLIELLVVIAVIGILATIVLMSLSNVQDRAKDTRIKASLSQIRAMAEMEATPLGDYSGVCTAIMPSTVYTDLATMSGASSTCTSLADGWCVSVPTNNDGTWCSDREKVEAGTCAGTGSIVCTP